MEDNLPPIFCAMADCAVEMTFIIAEIDSIYMHDYS